MSGYGQFCPVAKAMELFDERWTLLVVREMLLGSCHFNELRRGVPKMSPALLSKRLKSLVRAGVVDRSEADGRTTYTLTARGRELAEVVDALGRWGVRWIGELGDADLDPHLLMWDIRRGIPLEAWPVTRTTLAFRLTDVPPRTARWWLVVNAGEADVCDVDPGFEVTGVVSAGLRTLTRLWRGDLTWQQALLDGRVTISGPVDVRRAVPHWIGQSRMATVPRPA
ncbi:MULTISPECIES: helix-turn-helix domain-containing protein [Mycobacteriaceae]|uniref:winged helix-turn-helix transcriptional regulator n=1 Tax=Mycobacteriaceae TaxID=1762 RepID=UPI0007FE946C|nr:MULTISPECIES: helix-turn-helix domain-containing protein [Mycobacteriaceae]MCK0174909.1 helix-turn-helix transcriptional regulator [Mycolicibacterium sp. F2034L]OBB59266.1 HxlR family transcriptional regulator [Mycobacterium sp. 852013-51886_SCH5428379]